MTVTLDLPGELERRLALEASRQGLSVDQFVLRAALCQMGESASAGNAGFGVPSVDPDLEAAGVRTKAAAAELEAQGITDCDGNRVRTDLPEDMIEGAARDFGG